MVVRLERDGSRLEPDVYVDSRRASWAELPRLLRAGLSRRPPSWPIYLFGDPEIQYGWAVKVVDVARGVGGKVVLVERSSRIVSTP